MQKRLSQVIWTKRCVCSLQSAYSLQWVGDEGSKQGVPREVFHLQLLPHQARPWRQILPRQRKHTVWTRSFKTQQITSGWWTSLSRNKGRSQGLLKTHRRVGFAKRTFLIDVYIGHTSHASLVSNIVDVTNSLKLWNFERKRCNIWLRKRLEPSQTAYTVK